MGKHTVSGASLKILVVKGVGVRSRLFHSETEISAPSHRIFCLLYMAQDM